MKPEQGKIYVSEVDPTIRLYIEAVHIVEADPDPEEGFDETFHVEACDEKDRYNEGGLGIEFTGYEWNDFEAEHRLKPLP